MDNPLLIQKSVRNNSEDLSNFMRDLKHWEADMKRKDAQLQLANSLQNKPNTIVTGLPLPPVRRIKREEDGERQHHHSTDKDRKTKRRIPSCDYSLWEKFDVDKACEEIEKEDCCKSNNGCASHDDDVVANERLQHQQAIHHKELGNLLVKNGKWIEAIDKYTKAISCYNRDPIFYANRALCYLKIGRYAESEQDCTVSIRMDASYVKSYQRRAAARSALGDYKSALSDLETVLRLEPNNSHAKLESARLALATVIIIPQDELLIVSWKCLEGIGWRDKSTWTIKGQEETPPQEDDGLMMASSSSWRWSGGVKVVGEDRGYVKPPHQRSKRPLLRLRIADVSGKGKAELEEGNNGGGMTRKSKICLSADLPALPQPPKTSVQFHMAWRKLQGHTHLLFKYLTSVDCASIGSLFQGGSLESGTLSSILFVMAVEFVRTETPAVGYLEGLTRVPRFAPLALFMSDPDKEAVQTLIRYSIKRNELTKQEADQLRIKYNLTKC